MSELQEAPYVVKVEATEGCNLRCHFCGIAAIRPPGTQGARSGPYEYMAVRTARRLAIQMAEAGWNSRIEFAMHGEPTLNEDLHLLVQQFRMYLPRASIMLTTNAIPLVERGWRTEITKLEAAGLNIAAVDDYPPHRAAPTIRTDTPSFVELREYPADKAGNPHRRRKPDQPLLVSVMESIATATDGTHSTLNNGAGNSFPPPDEPVQKRCARPFREFAVRWDGTVALCCNDWRGEYKIGTIEETACDRLWQSAPFRSARRFLYAKDRDFGVCRGCDDFGGYRPGLLPDQRGKRVLPPPTEHDRAIAEEAMAGPSYTRPVERKWEQQIELSRKP